MKPSLPPLSLCMACALVWCAASPLAAQTTPSGQPSPSVQTTPSVQPTDREQKQQQEVQDEDRGIAVRNMNGAFGPPVIFRDTEYGTGPHPGLEEAPSRGYSHYDFPSERHGLWYRPKSFGLKMPQRCAAAPFRPRGYGDLFNRPVTCYRMDYHPYIVRDVVSRYGPTYYRRQPDPHCPPCMLFGLGGGY